MPDVFSNMPAVKLRSPVRLVRPDPDATGPGRALDPPEEVVDASAPLELERSFAILDLCGFTSYTWQHGVSSGRDVLVSFRALVRAVAARRAMRVARWIGDGVLLVGLSADLAVATAADIVARVNDENFSVRAGVDTGAALLFDGDDYVGSAVNVASRLCDLAEPGEVLATVASCTSLPSWLAVEPAELVEVRGVTGPLDVHRVRVSSSLDVALWELPADPADPATR